MNRSANAGGAVDEALVQAALDQNPDLEEQHVREAVRFLHRKSGVLDGFLKARLRGVDYREVLQAYLAVEHVTGDGPREPVLRAIQRRLESLANIGDRDQRGLEPIGRDVPAKDVRFVDDDGEPYKRTSNQYAGSLLDRREPALATDGGEHS